MDHFLLHYLKALDLVVVDFCSVWNRVDDALLSKEGLLELAWIFCRE